MNEVLGQLGEIGEIEQEGQGKAKVSSGYFTNKRFDLLQVQCLAACEDQINQISISQSRLPNR